MSLWQAGDRATLVNLPARARHFLGQPVTVVRTGGYGIAVADVAVRLPGLRGLVDVHAHQLVPIDLTATAPSERE